MFLLGRQVFVGAVEGQKMGEGLSAAGWTAYWSLSCIPCNPHWLVCLWLCLLLTFKCALNCWFLGKPQQYRGKAKIGCEMVGKDGERGVGCPEC